MLFKRTDNMLQQRLDREITDLEAMLQMIAPRTSIIINDQIGLIGEGVEETTTNILTASTISNVGRACDGIRHLPFDVNRPEIKGKEFRVLDIDGCIIIDYPIIHTGIVKNNKDKTLGYVFILKDYKAKDPFEDFFNNKLTAPAIIIYVDGELYINNVVDEKLLEQFKLDTNLKMETISHSNYLLTFKNRLYYGDVLDRYNNVYVYKERRLRL